MRRMKHRVGLIVQNANPYQDITLTTTPSHLSAASENLVQMEYSCPGNRMARKLGMHTLPSLEIFPFSDFFLDLCYTSKAWLLPKPDTVKPWLEVVCKSWCEGEVPKLSTVKVASLRAQS